MKDSIQKVRSFYGKNALKALVVLGIMSLFFQDIHQEYQEVHHPKDIEQLLNKGLSARTLDQEYGHLNDTRAFFSGYSEMIQISVEGTEAKTETVSGDYYLTPVKGKYLVIKARRASGTDPAPVWTPKQLGGRLMIPQERVTKEVIEAIKKELKTDEVEAVATEDELSLKEIYPLYFDATRLPDMGNVGIYGVFMGVVLLFLSYSLWFYFCPQTHKSIKKLKKQNKSTS